MTFTVADIDEAVIDKYGNSTIDSWNYFLDDLNRNEAVQLPGINSWATLMDDSVASVEFDSYGDYTAGAVWFVFLVYDRLGVRRYFRREGYYRSFSGRELNGPTVEVEMGRVKMIEWKAI